MERNNMKGNIVTLDLSCAEHALSSAANLSHVLYFKIQIERSSDTLSLTSCTTSVYFLIQASCHVLSYTPH